MLEKVEKTAKNLDEALELAAKALGVSRDEVSYEVTREVGKGFMRFLVGTEIDITAWRKADEEKEKKAAEKAKEKAAAKENSAKEKNAGKGAGVKTDAVKETKEIKRSAEGEKAEEKPESAAQRRRDAKKTENEDFVIPKSAVDDAKYFVSGVLSKIGLKYELNVKLDSNVITIDVSGEKMGLLIGKRGDTLDAVQLLTGLYVNRNKNTPYIKVNIDTENYRSKREETLVRLAHGLERSVLRDKKAITLEPMTANERRIIHSALQDNPRIKTFSVGEEPNRRMVISLSKTDAE